MKNNSVFYSGPLFQRKFAPIREDFPTHPSDKFCAAHVERLMQLAGIPRRTTAEDVCALGAVASGQMEASLRRADEFFQDHAYMVPTGLSELPEPWLRGLPGVCWKLRQTGWDCIPFFICSLELSNGLLLVQFAQELPEPIPRLTVWDRIRAKLNSSLYPSCWRELKPFDRMRVATIRPSKKDFAEAHDEKSSERRPNEQ